MTTDAIEEIDWTAGTGAIHLQEQSECQHAEDVVAVMYEDVEHITRGDVEEALDKLDARDGLSDVQCNVIEGMADANVDQLRKAPITSIYEAGDRSTLDTAVQLFDFGVEVDDDGMHEDGSYRPEVTSVDT